jgi:arginine/ornithine transport system ATP-binding protein
MSKSVLCEEKDNICLITLNEEDTRNAISPEILLFDEPTSSLDPELVDEVLSVIRNLAEQGKTMLVVTHEMEFARKVSNNVIFLHDGLVEEEGHPDTVFTNPQSERCRNFLFNRRE